jgi:hypothetical protein
MLFSYPKAAFFGKVLPKNKIYLQAKPTKRIQDLFVRQVDKITWLYKLSKETTNLSPGKEVLEIEIFHILLKEEHLHKDIISTLDRAIPHPVIYEVEFDNKIKSIAAFKRPNEKASGKSVVGRHFESQWFKCDMQRDSLPPVLDLATMYKKLLQSLYPSRPHDSEDLANYAQRMEDIMKKTDELNMLKKRLKSEKQYNRKVEINRGINELRFEIMNLE